MERGSDLGSERDIGEDKERKTSWVERRGGKEWERTGSRRTTEGGGRAFESGRGEGGGSAAQPGA